jgi:hypothetical protein
MRLAVEIILKKIVSKLFKDDGDLKSNDTWKRLPHLKQDGDFSKGGGDIFSIFFAFSNNN